METSGTPWINLIRLMVTAPARLLRRVLPWRWRTRRGWMRGREHRMSDRPNERFDRFTERARRVLSLAHEEAARFNHNYIGTEHLLLGLIRERDGVAARVLSDMRVDLPKARSAVEFIIGLGEGAPQGEIGLTPRARRVIELAFDEARRQNHHYLGTEHLLLGLVREGEGIGAGVLESLGIRLEAVRARVIQIINQSSAYSRRDPTDYGTDRERLLHEQLASVRLWTQAALDAGDDEAATNWRAQEYRLLRLLDDQAAQEEDDA